MVARTDTHYQRVASVMSSRVDDETIILSVEQGQYYSFGTVGTVIWEQLAEPSTRDDLVEHVCEMFDVDAENCEYDVDAFLSQLQSVKLIEEAPKAT